MDIESLIDDSNEELYNRVREHFQVKLEENPDWRAEDAWVSEIHGDTAIIAYCYNPIEFPRAAFVRELLHIDIHIKGFRKILAGISLRKEVQTYIPTIQKILNYNFQGHKIAKDFLSQGYLLNQIYDDDGSPTIKFLEEQLKEEGRSMISLSMMYMLLMDPFMCIADEDKHSIKRKFEEYEGGRFKQKFRRIEEVMDSWANDESYDAESYRIDFLRNIGVTDSWFSYKHDSSGMYEHEFPDCGFFVDTSFTYDEVAKEYGH